MLNRKLPCVAYGRGRDPVVIVGLFKLASDSLKDWCLPHLPSSSSPLFSRGSSFLFKLDFFFRRNMLGMEIFLCRSEGCRGD